MHMHLNTFHLIETQSQCPSSVFDTSWYQTYIDQLCTKALPVLSTGESLFWVPTSHFSSINRNLLFSSITQSGAHGSRVIDPTLLSPTHTPAHNARNHNTKILPDVCHSVSPDPIQDNFNKDVAKISSQHSEELDNRNDFNENSKSPTTALLFWMITLVHLSRY